VIFIFKCFSLVFIVGYIWLQVCANFGYFWLIFLGSLAVKRFEIWQHWVNFTLV